MTNQHTTLRILSSILLILSGIISSYAFEASHYPDESVLSSGRWVKMSISRDGLHGIPQSTLRSWGFSDPARVRIYGRGAHRIPDALTPESYPGDLELVQSVVENGTVIFYAQGPGEWLESDNNRYRYEMNVYANAAYYYITESDTAARAIPEVESYSAGTYVSTYMARLHHELEQFSPGDAGPLLVGENFMYNRSLFIDFDVADVADTQDNLWFETSFVSYFENGTPSLNFTVNGASVPTLSTDRLPAQKLSSYAHGSETVTRHSYITLSPESSKLRLGITLTGGGTPHVAALNYVSVNYLRNLKFTSSGAVEFTIPNQGAFLAESQATIWDVSDPLNICEIKPEAHQGGLRWARTSSGSRDYAAWRTGASLPSPKYEGALQNQNLHGLRDINMVIVSPAAYLSDAERLAAFHRNSSDSLSVAVVTPEQIYNEFSSGNPEPAGLRNFFKMLYDRGIESGNRFSYALLIGRMSVDNRRLIPTYGQYPIIPGWAPRSVRSSLSDNEGYFTDDFTAMLEDGSGASLKTDVLSIAIGRMPVLSADETRNVVDKTIEYATGDRHSQWRQRMLMLADDGDRGVHLTQMETMAENYLTPGTQPFMPRRVYMDAYTMSGGIYPQARELMFRYLDEGVVWWNFIGHANTTGWTSEGQLSYTDLNNLYLRNLPFIYAATCNFLRLDAPSPSGAEIMYKERYGGCIGVISAMRPVYIPDNGNLTAALGRALGSRDERGNLLTPGEAYRRAKNDIRNADGKLLSDDNRLRYIFLGDPALPLCTPNNRLRVDSINGVETGADVDLVMAALQRATVSGTVTDGLGNELTSFNGTILIDIYDAEQSVTTVGNNGGTKDTYEDYGERIFCGSAPVVNGKFTVNVSMPTEIKQNYRPATMCLYAYSTDRKEAAADLFNDFYVYGEDETAPEDNNPPVIEELFLNHSDFSDGGTVNDKPMLIARVSDDTGINVSTAGIGHSMTVVVDEKTSLSDVTNYYTPNADGSVGGVINYPLSTLAEGNHKLALRVWDTSGNSVRREIEFYVQPGLAPTIYDVYTDANPASTVANFYLTHDQPDAMVTVTIEVFNLMGRPVWGGRAEGRSDMMRSVPVTWNLTDNSGARVPRGIYLYRATISAGGQNYTTASRRIAVTAQ